MKQYFKHITICLFSLLTSIQIVAQTDNKHRIIPGTDNLVNAINSAFNSVSYLRVGNVKNDINHHIWIENQGVIYHIGGFISIDHFDITMPDGIVVTYIYDASSKKYISNNPVFKPVDSGYEFSPVKIKINATAAIKPFEGFSLTKDNYDIWLNEAPPYSTGHGEQFGYVKNEFLKEKYGRITSNGLKIWDEVNDEIISNISNANPQVNLTISGLSQDWSLMVNNFRNSYNSIKSQDNPATSTSINTNKNSISSAKKDTNSTQSNTIGNTGKTYEQLEYERQENERQQKEKIQMAINPGGTIMEKSGLNDYYRNEIAKANREADLRREREEREWEVEKKRIRQQRIEEDRRAEEYRKQQEEQRLKYNLSLEEAYQKKGGDANFNAKLKEIETKIFSTIHEVNEELIKNGNKFTSFSYLDNCSYVNIIETIQTNKNLPYNRKLILIEEILALKKAYVDFYMANSKHGYDYGKNPDYQDITSNAECSQYLRTLANSLSAASIEQSKTSIGLYNMPITFINDFKSTLGYLLEWHIFDYYSNRKTNKSLEEIKRIKETFEKGRKYHALKDIDELTLALLNYTHGFFEDALSHYKVYELKHDGKERLDKPIGHYLALDKEIYVNRVLGVVLYIENNDYNTASRLLDELEMLGNKFLTDPAIQGTVNSQNHTILKSAILKLKNIIFYETGNYDKMWLPKEKSDFISKSKQATYSFLQYYNGASIADALYKKGNKDLAEEIINELVSYNKKTFKFNYKYDATKTETEAFKRMLIAFDPKSIEKLGFNSNTKYRLNVRNISSIGEKMLTLEPSSTALPQPINHTIIDLKNEVDWINNKIKIHFGLPKEDLKVIFNNLFDIYKKGKISVSEESKGFLSSLIFSGVLLGNFYEVMPAMTDLKNNYDIKDYILFEKLLVLMTSYNGDLTSAHFNTPEVRNSRWSDPKNYENSTIDWFRTNTKEPFIKQDLNQILDTWATYEYSHVLIPFLYDLNSN